MKRRLQTALLVVVVAAYSTHAMSAEHSDGRAASSLTYTPLNLIAHSIERLQHNQSALAEIRLVNFKLFGLDTNNALLTANFEAITDRARNVPQVYALILRTSDGGSTWTQVLDSIDRRIPYITDVKFIGKRGLLLYEHSMAGNHFGFLYSQNQGKNWIVLSCRLVGPSSSARNRRRLF